MTGLLWLGSGSDEGLAVLDAEDFLEVAQVVMPAGLPQAANAVGVALLDVGQVQADPENASLWRFARRRLDAEAIRDAMLAVSGGLDRSPGGPHPFPEQTSWDFTQHKPFKAVYDSTGALLDDAGRVVPLQATQEEAEAMAEAGKGQDGADKQQTTNSRQ